MSDMISVVIIVVSAVFGAFATIVVQFIRFRHSIKLKNYDIQIKNFEEFLKDEGLSKLLNFFKNNNPDSIQRHLGVLEDISKIHEEHKSHQDQLDKVERLLAYRLFNPVTAIIHQHIESNARFIDRLKENDKSKIILSELLPKFELIRKILENDKSIFIESGSTLSYCMLSFIRFLSDHADARTDKKLKVCTNNISIYMILLFEENLEPVLLPGKPTNQYGATFADIPEDEDYTEDYQDGAVWKFLESNNVTTLFTTSSFIDIECGPHVSSKQNHIIKRILNDYANKKNATNIHVIVADKINNYVTTNPDKIGKQCKFIFDEEGEYLLSENSNTNKLDKTKNAWRTHLSQPNNYIITSSSSDDVVMNVKREFEDAFQQDIYVFEDSHVVENKQYISSDVYFISGEFYAIKLSANNK